MINNKNDSNIELTNREKEILEKIYNIVYKTFVNTQVDIFLCGGDATGNTVRKNLRDKFKNSSSIKIFYPEEIFAEYYNLYNKKVDYLTLENILADNVDFICIICESPGALVELGAFMNDEKIRHKIIAINHKNNKRKDSFINLGPIKLLQNISKTKGEKAVIFYGLEYEDESVTEYTDEDIVKLHSELNNKFKKYLDLKQTQEPRTIDKITGMFYFKSLLLYLFKGLEKTKLSNYVNYIVSKIGSSSLNYEYDLMDEATNKLLFNENFIKNTSRTIVELTKNGSKYMYELIHKDEKDIYNDVISDIIKLKYYHYSS